MEIEKYTDPKDAFLAQMEELRPDLFYPVEWDDSRREKANAIIKPGKVRASIFTAIPMICQGELCVYASTCQYLKDRCAPIDHQCPYETSIVSQFSQAYIETLGVDTENMIEVGMIRDLVNQDVQYLRVNKLLADEHFVVENPVGVDAEGNVALKKELHPGVEMEDRILRRKDKILSAFMATREARAKVGQGVQDQSQMVSDMMDIMRDIKHQRNREKLDLLGIGSSTSEYIKAMKNDAADVVDAEVVEDSEE